MHVAGILQALVEEQLGRGQYHRTVDIVLPLQPGQVAAPHRAHAAVAGQRWHFVLVEPFLQADAVQRLQAAVGGGQVEDVAQEVLHRPGRAQPVERAHHEGGIAQPAIAVIPVAGAARGLGNGGGHRRDDRAAVLVLAQLEGDGAADHRVLPFQRDGQVAGPFAPVVLGALLRFLRVAGERAVQRLVHAQYQFHGVGEHERQRLADEAHRHVGGQAQGEIRQQPAQVVAAPGAFGNACAPVGQRPRQHADARVAGQRADAPDQARRTVEAVVAAPARGEVDHFHLAAMGVAQHRAQDRGVGDVVLLAAGVVLQLDGEVAAVMPARRQQRAERRVAVERGQATPHHACMSVDQGAETAIADDAHLEVGLKHRFLHAGGEARPPRGATAHATGDPVARHGIRPRPRAASRASRPRPAGRGAPGSGNGRRPGSRNRPAASPRRSRTRR